MSGGVAEPVEDVRIAAPVHLRVVGRGEEDHRLLVNDLHLVLLELPQDGQRARPNVAVRRLGQKDQPGLVQ